MTQTARLAYGYGVNVVQDDRVGHKCSSGSESFAFPTSNHVVTRTYFLRTPCLPSTPACDVAQFPN